MNKRVQGNLMLLLTAMIWGMGFVAQKAGAELEPFTYNGIRMMLGGIALLPVIAWMQTAKRKREIPSLGEQKKEHSKDNDVTSLRSSIRGGICCGLLLCIASNLQQFGLYYQTDAGKAGFITTLYIIFVPIAGVFFRRKVPGIVWIGAVMAAAGMYLLCMTESLVLGTGDLLVFFCAIVFTSHILLVDYFSPKTDGVIISCIQFAVCGFLCTGGAFVLENPTWQQLQGGAGALAYAGVLSCGVAYTLQIVGQNGVNPTVAALLLSLESVFATISGWIAYKIGFLKTDQTMTERQIAGCILVFGAVILVQLPAKWFHLKKKETENT